MVSGTAMEQQGRKLLHDLGERVKELTALHGAARLLQMGGADLGQLFHELVVLLPPGWQYPEVAAARVAFDGHETRTPNFVETAWRQASPFTTADGRRGVIEVVYLEERPPAVEGPFLAEERTLLDSLADMLRTHLDRRATEEALARQALLLGNVRDAIIVTDLTGSVNYWNDGATQLFGWTAQEMLGTQYAERFPDPEVRAFVASRICAVANGEDWAGEWQDYHKDGSRIWVDARVRRITDPTGKPIGIMGLAHDISRRKGFEEALRQSEEHYHFLAESFPLLVWMTRPDGYTDYVNRRWESYAGLSPEEILDWDWLRVLHPDDRARSRGRWETAVRTGEPYENEYRLRRKDGVYRWHVSRGVALRDREGRIVRWFGTCTDIHDHRETVEQKLALARHIRLLLESTGEGIYGLDEHGRCTFINRAGAAMLGYAPEEVIGQDLHALTHHSRADGSPYPPQECPNYYAFRAGRGVRMEDEVLWRKDGTCFPVAYTSYPVAEDDFRGAVVTFNDITDRKRLEAQLRQAQKMEAIGQLAGGVAHDFNNLLTVINGYGELVMAGLPPADPSRELIREMVAAGHRAAGLTRQLLAFSRKAILEPRILDLKAMVADLDRMLRRIIGEDIRLAVVTDPELGAVKADPGQIEQVVLNLVVNARDAMPQGGRLTIEVRNTELDETYARSHPDARPGPQVLLAISDTGCGMDQATLARIFEPFFTTKGERGTGLGLATVHGIIKQSGGHVTVYSEVGHGTTFKVYLPRVEQRAPSGKSFPGVAVMPRGNETVLLVEDEDSVRALARHVLQACGYTVVEAQDGAEAVRMAGQHRGRIHLLVSDVVLPRVGGRAAAERLTAMRPEMKVLFLSGYTDDAVVRHGILEAQVAFLHKPFTPASLAAKVREVLDTRSSPGQNVPSP